MASFYQVISLAIAQDKMKMVSVNQNLIQVSRENGKKCAYVKTAVTDELAQGLMHRKRVAFILHIDADELNAIEKEIDADDAEIGIARSAIEPTEIAQAE